MNSVSQAETRQSLTGRLQRLTPDAQRQWGSLTPAEMLCHLGDSLESVLRIRIPPGPAPSGKPRPFMKWFILYAPLRWPKGVKTRPGVDPRLEGTRPSDFERDRARVLKRLEELATAPAERVAPIHFMVGPMSLKDWQRWAFKHADHHLRQFGL